MQNTLLILDLLETHQVEITAVLAAKRPLFIPSLQTHQQTLAQLKRQAASLPDNDKPLTPAQLAVQTDVKHALSVAANDLLQLFLQDDTITEIITRPPKSHDSLSERRGYLDNYEPQSRIPLQGIANDFYLLLDQFIQGAVTNSADHTTITRPPSPDSSRESGEQKNGPS